MDKKELVKQLKQYALKFVEVENIDGTRMVNGCDVNAILDDLEKEVIKSLESKNKIEVYW